MHTEQKVWSNWSLRQQNDLNYPTFTEYFVITWLRTYVYCLYAISNYIRHVAMLQKFAGPLVGAPFCGGPCSAEHAEHAYIRFRVDRHSSFIPSAPPCGFLLWKIQFVHYRDTARSNVGVHNTTNIYTGKRQKITKKNCEQ